MLQHLRKSNLLIISVIIFIILALGLNYLVASGVPYYYNSDLSSPTSYAMHRSNDLLNGILFNPWWVTTSRPAFNIDPLFFTQIEACLYIITENIWLNYQLIQIIQLAISAVSMYLLAYFYTKNKFASFIAAFIYAFTPYSLGKLAVHANSLSWAYSLLPLGYLSIERAISGKTDIKKILIAGLIVALTMFLPSLNYVYINGLFYFFFIVFRLMSRGHSLKKIGQKLVIGISIFAIGFALSAYVIVPTLLEPFPLSNQLGQTKTIFSDRYNEGLSGTWANTLLQSLSLQDREIVLHAESTGRFDWSREALLYVLPLGTILLASSAYLFTRKKDYKIVNTYMFLGLISVLFAAGAKAPLLQFYVWCLRFLPFFYTIRVSSRFEIHAALAFSLLACMAISGVLRYFEKNNGPTPRFSKRKILSYSLIALAITPSFASAYLNSTLGPAYTFKTETIPNDVTAAVNFWNTYYTGKSKVLDFTNSAGNFDKTYTQGTYALFYTDDLIKKYYGTEYFAEALAYHNVEYMLYDPIKTRNILQFWELDTNFLDEKILKNSDDWDVTKIYGSNDIDPQSIIISSSDDWIFGYSNEDVATEEVTSVIYNASSHMTTNLYATGTPADNTTRIRFYLSTVPENQMLTIKVLNLTNSTVFESCVMSSNLKYGWNEVELNEAVIYEDECYSVIFSAPNAGEPNYFLMGNKKTNEPSDCYWSSNGENWNPYYEGFDMLVEITYNSFPKNLEPGLASYNGKNSIMTLSTNSESEIPSSQFYVHRTGLNYSTDEYTNVIYKARVSDPYTQLKLSIIYSDGTSTVDVYSGFVWRSKMVSLQPNKTVSAINLRIEPVGNVPKNGNWHYAYVGTMELYILKNKEVQPKIYAANGYLWNEDLMAFDPDKYYSTGVNFSTQAYSENIFENSTTIVYDDVQKRVYFWDPGYVTWKFTTPYPILRGGIRAEIAKNIIDGANMTLYVSTDNVNWICIGSPQISNIGEWVTGNLPENASTFYLKIESTFLGGSIFDIRVSTELSSPEVPAQISYYERTPTEYIVNINSTGSFYLIFTETFSPGWVGYLDSVKLYPESFDNNTLNAFYLNKTGVYTMKIVYENTLVRSFSFLFSGLVLSIIVIVITYPYLRKFVSFIYLRKRKICNRLKT